MDDYLRTLNSAQRQAVQYGKGPLMIVAGAGTGKTRVLVNRLFHLVQSELARPEEILALTFTDKATTEMQERVDELFPYGYGEIHIKTFHGLSDMILRERGLILGLNTDYRILSKSDLILFLRKQLFTFPLKHYRPLGNPMRFIQSLVGHFNQLRDETISPAAYLKYAQEIQDLEPQDHERLLEVANAYVHYGALLIQHDVLDFSALNYLTWKLLNEHETIRKEYAEQFKFILVDEFQDTNTVQNKIVQLLARDHQNLMVVGDDDQSIYRWRGASLANILEFGSHFPEAERVVLTENYRSTQPILDLSYHVIQHNNPLRLEVKNSLNKRLSANVDSESSDKPRVLHFSHYDEEVRFVVQEICHHVETHSDHRYGDCAILVRASAHATPFLEALNQAGIPVYFSGHRGLFMNAAIKDLMAFLRIMVNPYDDIALFRLLSLPYFDFDSGYLFSLLQKSKSSSTPLLKTLRNAQDSPDLFSSLGSGASLTRFLSFYQDFQTLTKNHTPSHLIGRFLDHTGYIKALQDASTSEAEQNIESIAAFSQLIRSFEEIQADRSLSECLDYLQARQDLGDDASLPDSMNDSDVVKILTIHSAKGLEFKRVFMVNLVKGRFPVVNRRPAFEIPGSLLESSIQEEDPHLNEERRLFYVAMTRAQFRLDLTYSDHYGGKKAWKPSPFIQESLDSNLVDFVENGATLVRASKPISVLAAEDPGDRPLLFAHRKPRHATRLSFSRINTFQSCPLKYKFKYLYQLSEPLSHAASFGSSLHNALNSFYQKFKSGQDPSLELLRTCYDAHWIRVGYTSIAHHDARRKEGWEILKQYYEAHSSAWIIPDSLERSFTLKLPSGLSVSGRIDRIDRLEDGTYEVIDYKTGRLKDENQARKDLQLSIYALACRDIFGFDVSRLSLYYLSEGRKLSASRSAEDLEATFQELETIADTIHDSQFEATPSAYVCQYCPYRVLCHKSAV